jgi:hypothetical protein
MEIDAVKSEPLEAVPSDGFFVICPIPPLFFRKVVKMSLAA